MSDGTGISWADATWNPVVGCTRVSAGCDHCYAVPMTYRLGCAAAADALAGRDPGRKKPYVGLTVLNQRGERHFNGVVRCVEEALPLPMKWKKPRRIFVNSMGDLFHRDVPTEFIGGVFAVMAQTPRHTYKILTKRPERMVDVMPGVRSAMIDILTMLGGGYSGIVAWPLPNVQLGVSAEDQATWDERVPHLLRCPAAVRIVSCEPLLGEIDCSGMFGGEYVALPGDRVEPHYNFGVHQVIIGGESGARSRPCDVRWIRSIRDQCAAAGVACWVKQLGARPMLGDVGDPHGWPTTDGPVNWETGAIRLIDRAGADMSEWPEDLRVQQEVVV